MHRRVVEIPKFPRRLIASRYELCNNEIGRQLGIIVRCIDEKKIFQIDSRVYREENI